jgi:flagellar basal body-associated protein FliL
VSDDELEDIDLSEEDETDSEPEPVERKEFRHKKLVALASILLLQIVAAYAVAHFLILPRLPGGSARADTLAVDEAVQEKESRRQRQRGSIVMIEDVVVNVRDIEKSRLLMVSAAIEYKGKGLETEIAERMPELRAMLIDHLTNNQVAELVHREGRDRVKRELLVDMNLTLRKGDLLNIYFSNFVVQ